MRVDTPVDNPAPLVVRVVELTRRQLLVLALLACIPLPVLSFATAAAPLPEIVQRAAAGLIPFSPSDRGTPTGRENIAPRSRGVHRRTPAKRSPAPTEGSRASSPRTQKAATGKARSPSVRKHPSRAAPSVSIAPTHTTIGTSGPPEPTTPNTSGQPAPVQAPSPSVGAHNEKKSNGKGGDKVSPAATKPKGEPAANGQGKPAANGQDKPTGGDGGNGQQTGQDAAGGKPGDKSKP
jgi:hypothetical protein